MSDITTKLDNLKAVASNKGATKGERDAAMLMIGKLVSKHDVAFSMPTADIPHPQRQPSAWPSQPQPSPSAPYRGDTPEYWMLYIPNDVLNLTEFRRLLAAMKESSFMRGNIFVCTDFTKKDQLTRSDNRAGKRRRSRHAACCWSRRG